VETLGGVATTLIPRNTPIPIKKSDTFTTAADMQAAVTIHVYQGERPMARDNTGLGEFNLEGLIPAPRGIPKIEVTFDIDASGILSVTAKDSATGKSQSIKITGSTRLPEAEKARMIKQAEQYADEDRRRREQVEKLNNADAMCYQGERFLADYGEKTTADQRAAVDKQLKDLKSAISKKDVDAATSLAETLKKLLQEAGAALYGQARAETERPAAEAGKAAGRPPGERVVDAEYHETKP
jgi:molecular chaperone DnaK